VTADDNVFNAVIFASYSDGGCQRRERERESEEEIPED
jgi:hypothetical protein